MKAKISQSPVLTQSSDEQAEYSCFFVVQSQRTSRPSTADTVEGSFCTSQRSHPEILTFALEWDVQYFCVDISGEPAMHPKGQVIEGDQDKA
jgi:hypothetical protein